MKAKFHALVKSTIFYSIFYETTLSAHTLRNFLFQEIYALDYNLLRLFVTFKFKLLYKYIYIYI